MAKPSEKYSVVPESLRNKFREYKKSERKEDKQEYGSSSEEGPSEQDKEALNRLFEENKGYAKGGMVKRGPRGDGCAVKGHTKGTMY